MSSGDGLNENINRPSIMMQWLPLIMTVAFLVAYYSGDPIFMGLLLIAIAVSVVLRLIYLGFWDPRFKDSNISTSQLIQTSFVIAFPILVLPNIRIIDYACTYVAVRIMEPYLMEKMDRIPNQTFKYMAIGVQVGAYYRWIYYDESDQVLLMLRDRSEDWWVNTKEDRYNDCGNIYSKQTKLLYSHFYVLYPNCE